jgi:mannitol/fructose-specific phosphotransferase system IIA component (Ntr-type)
LADVDRFVEQFDFILQEAVLRDLYADDKESAIRVLVGSLVEAGAMPSSAEPAITAAVLQREAIGTTGIGKGLAIPHAKHPAANRVMAAVGYCPHGVDFDSLDGELVHLIVLLVSPPESAHEHVQALGAISRFLIESRLDFTSH